MMKPSRSARCRATFYRATTPRQTAPLSSAAAAASREIHFILGRAFADNADVEAHFSRLKRLL